MLRGQEKLQRWSISYGLFSDIIYSSDDRERNTSAIKIPKSPPVITLKVLRNRVPSRLL